MTSVTSPQQTDRRGTGEIPGPRGGQGVRLLVLGADPDAQELRDQAAAAGYELAQRYSARVSHVAYGAGIDPDDSRYTKIRDAGLRLLPLQKCAEELGLGAEDGVAAANAPEGADVADAADGVDVAEVAEVADDAGDDVADASEPVEATGAADAAEPVDVTDAAEPVDVTDADVESLEIPPLRGADVEPEVEAEPEAFEASGTDSVEAETMEAADVDASDEDWLAESAADFVPGFSTGAHDLPLAASVIGADPWTGGEDGAGRPEGGAAGRAADSVEAGAAEVDMAGAGVAEVDVAKVDMAAAGVAEIDVAEAAETGVAEIPVRVELAAPDRIPDAAARAADSRSAARRMLLSIVWALIPFATFGLLTPVTFGYAACRLRSRALVLSALGYTVAVVASFVLSAARPHSATPTDTSGALLTLALAATWLGGTLHAVSIRTRVFAR